MKHFLISLLLLYFQDTLKAQSVSDTIYVPRGSIRVFDTAKKVWLINHYFNSGGLSCTDEYDSSDFKHFKTITAFNLDGSYALKLNALRGSPEGNYEDYYDHGQPKQAGHFYNGYKTGKWLEYYPDGKLAAEYLYQLTHEDSTFNAEKYRFKDNSDPKVSIMKVEWGHDDLSPDSYLKYKDIVMYQFVYLSPTTPPKWKKYNPSGEIIETSENCK